MIQDLRAKKNLMMNQIDNHKKDEKETVRKSISDILEKHQNYGGKVFDHIEKQSTNQEDQFNKKMRERKDRSISRSLNKSTNDSKLGKQDNESEEGGKKENTKAFKLYQHNLKFNPDSGK